jgi:hypothetical protein
MEGVAGTDYRGNGVPNVGINARVNHGVNAIAYLLGSMRIMR